MKPEFNYQLIPYGFAHCLNRECKRANECLRSRAVLHLPSDRDTFTIVNPARTTTNGEDCHFFKEDKLKQFARGMTHLLDHIPHNDAVIIKRQMLNHFGKTLSTASRWFHNKDLAEPLPVQKNPLQIPALSWDTRFLLRLCGSENVL